MFYNLIFIFFFFKLFLNTQMPTVKNEFSINTVCDTSNFIENDNVLH